MLFIIALAASGSGISLKSRPTKLLTVLTLNLLLSYISQYGFHTFISVSGQYNTKLMVVGGWREDNVDADFDVEVIDLANQDSTCFKPRDIPLRHGSVGTFINSVGGAFVCADDDDKDCYIYKSSIGKTGPR